MWGRLSFVKHRKTGTFHVDQKTLNHRRRMGYVRAVSSAGALCLGGFMIYCSLHYAGAFVNVGKIVGLSSVSASNAAYEDLDGQTGFFEPVKKHFRLNRVYLRANQGIQAQYKLPPGTTAKVYIRRCASFPVVEVFHCNFVSTSERVIDQTAGRTEFFVREPGFYYFSHDIETVENEDVDYFLVWRRV